VRASFIGSLRAIFIGAKITSLLGLIGPERGNVMKMIRLRNTRCLTALAVAATAWLAAPAASRASLIFDFSFTGTTNTGITATVMGEIDGLTNNATTAATHVTIDSVTGITAPFTLPHDTISDPVFVNFFIVSNDQIVGEVYNTATTDYTFGIKGGGIFDNNITKVSLTTANITFTLVPEVPEPSALVLLGTALAGLFLFEFRANRRDRQNRPHQPSKSMRSGPIAASTPPA
jgi:hypothetical protein